MRKAGILKPGMRKAGIFKTWNGGKAVILQHGVINIIMPSFGGILGLLCVSSQSLEQTSKAVDNLKKFCARLIF
jgi:hypothetical protein